MKYDDNIDMDTIVLEVNGERDILEYQRSLAEASLLGIDYVFFCCVWGKDEKKLQEMYKTLWYNCQSLNIIPLSGMFGYREEIFGEPMIGKADDEMSLLTSFHELIPFNYYKTSKNKTVDENSIDKVLTKIKQ